MENDVKISYVQPIIFAVYMWNISRYDHDYDTITLEISDYWKFFGGKFSTFSTICLLIGDNKF